MKLMSKKAFIIALLFLCILSVLAISYVYHGTNRESTVGRRAGTQAPDHETTHTSVVTSPGTYTSSKANTSGQVNISGLNPGCIMKKLSKYRALDTGRVYTHPPIVHYAKLSKRPSRMNLNFREYTSVLSVFKFLQPQEIIFHTYTGTSMEGKYWDIIRSWKNVLVKVTAISPVDHIDGKYVPYIQHEADYVKLKAVYKYGGIALDFDAIIVNATRLRYEQALSECVLSEEGQYINGGFYSCIKGSSYIGKWLEGYDKDYRPDLWLHNVSFRPRDLLIAPHSKVCYNVYLDNTICINPNWGKQREWLKSGVEWRKKTVAHYFVKTGIPNDGEGLLKESHSLAKLLQYVHEA